MQEASQHEGQECQGHLNLGKTVIVHGKIKQEVERTRMQGSFIEVTYGSSNNLLELTSLLVLVILTALCSAFVEASIGPVQRFCRPFRSS